LIANSITSQLLEGETILWSGAPGTGLRLLPRDAVLIPFSLLWCGFAIFWEYSVFNARHAPVFFRLWGIPFILAGLYAVFGRFLLDAWLRGRTFYALTDQRVLIVRPAPFGRFTALNVRQLPTMSFNEAADGSGTIRFGEAFSAFGRNNGFGVWTPALDPTPQWIAVPNAAMLFRQLQQAAAK
jgi:hypothetical protein